MDDDIAYCIEVLVDAVEQNDDGGWRYSGSEATRKHDRLSPIVVENLSLDPDSLRISYEVLESELNNLLLEVKGSDNPAHQVEEKLPEFKERLYGWDLSEYVVAFPLNFDRRSSELLPESPQVGDVVFERLPRSDWEERFVPDYDENHDNYHRQRKLMNFVDRSPNKLDHPWFTYWFTSYRARGEKYAVDHVVEQLEILLGMMNYSATFNRIQRFSQDPGPWPDRWGELREPFIYVLHKEDEFVRHYWSEDATLREADSPFSMHEDMFESLFEGMPTFEEEQSLDGGLLNSLRAFQAAMTEPSERESFFEFWRGIEILTLVEEGEKMSEVVDRAAAMLGWEDSELGRIRRNRAQNKRNSYVHEGAGLRLTVADRNLVKSLHESLICLYVDKRGDWGYEEMKFALEQFEVDEDQIENLRKDRTRELRLIDWFEDMAKED
ncbi:hypothetical protein [Halorientalis pallida]|uniref:Apea-like HEPN domain-containing protein n=1 Tax=Halorientalis pallida TaxID=2479928 RepID=A0A498KT06_9EURY|nr:hypothetical protein [Halorientalis pallida]RXK47786.1 hypothetical protein EAF64_14130 [Halorientalis pallida]